MSIERFSIKRRLVWPLGLGFLWLLFLLVLAVWSVRSERAHVDGMAEREAKAFFQQIVVTRAWNAAHGGVYVLATPENPPNPFLKSEDRTIETLQGVTLTKINPAYMTRQISSITHDNHEVQFHLTSLDPVRPANRADDWEVEALKEFNRGVDEKFEMVTTDKGDFFRYMAPLKAEQRCMRCHAGYGHQGKVILGGISVSFAAAPLVQTRKSSVAQTHIAFTLIFLVGFVGICGSTYQIQKKREEAEKADQTKSVFLANMSHDMRTPLNGIMGMTELIQKKGLSREQARQADMVRHSAWTLLEIITDITDFSRLESGRLELSEKVFDVREMLEDALDIFCFETKNKGLKLAGHVAEDVPGLLKGDAFRLKQVVTNLVGNAVKFTKEGSVSVRISLGGKRPHDGEDVTRLHVEVEDSGVGIPEEEQRSIFESFSQVDDSYAKKHEGSGLGLAICSQLVTMMGGSISVQSQLGEGALFFFDVVLSVPDESDALPVTEKTETVPDSVSVPHRVLVAEDNLLNQTFAKEILEDAGHSVMLVGNGAEAIDALRNHEFDIIFMDVQMPEMDGLEATRRIRDGEAGIEKSAVPIIAATAFAVQGDRETCLDAGMDGYVMKPLASHDLLSSIVRFTETKCSKESSPMRQSEVASFIDIPAALERLGGRRELFDKLAVTFLGDAPQKLAELSDSVASGHMDEVLRLAHGLKNSAGMIQASEMSEAAQLLEVAVREERLTEVPELFDVLQVAAEKSFKALSVIVEG